MVLETIYGLGKLTAALRRAVEAAATKSELEDLYLPYKSTRKTKADAAREAGLEPLLDALLADPSRFPAVEADAFVDAARGVATADDALAGARAILIERAGQDAALVGELRERLWKTGRLRSSVKPGRRPRARSSRTTLTLPSPRTPCPATGSWPCCAAKRKACWAWTWPRRTRVTPRPQALARAGYENAVARSLGIAESGRAADSWLMTSARLAWRTRILTRLSVDLRVRLFQSAEEESVRVFAANLRDVLLAAPAGNRATLGLDPGLRTGIKVAVVDGTGKVAATETIYPHAPARKWNESLATLVTLAQKHNVELDRDWQRHRQPRDGQAGRGTRRRAQAPPPGRAGHQARGLRGGRLRVLGVGAGQRRTARHGRVACAAPSPLPAACRTRWRNWSRSIPSPSAWASTSTTSPRPSWSAPWARWSRTA